MEHCKRRNGTERKWFETREQAEAFAADPTNVHYHGDVAHECRKCGWWHLSKISWIIPEWDTLLQLTKQGWKRHEQTKAEQHSLHQCLLLSLVLNFLPTDVDRRHFAVL